jgi:hypothetical protein
MSQQATVAPAAAKASAIALPLPCAAPVTTATRPLNPVIIAHPPHFILRLFLAKNLFLANAFDYI